MSDPAAMTLTVPVIPVQHDPLRSRVVKAQTVQHRDLTRAETLQAAVQEQTRREAELQQAFQAGVAEGIARAEAAGADAAPRIAAALERLAEEASRHQEQAHSQSGSAVIEAALDIAAWYLQCSVEAMSTSLLDRLREASARLMPSASATVTVSAADIEAVREWAAARPSLTVRVDPQLAPGEARLASGVGEADLTVATAMRRAADVLGVEHPAGDR